MDENFSRFGLDGGRDMGNLVLLDGVPDTAADWGGLLVSPSSEATQEMQVIRDTYDSQFGKTGGGVVSIVTKTGTDRFHGEAYGFLRNSALDATPWSGNTYTTCSAGESAHECDVSKKPEFKREEFGGVISGPFGAPSTSILWPLRWLAGYRPFPFTAPPRFPPPSSAKAIFRSPTT